MPFSESQRNTLLETAWDSIRHGLFHRRPPAINTADFDPALTRPGASFVTLHAQGALRGCIGSLEAYRPLIEDVSENAFAAAFRDPRFIPLQEQELDGINLDISVLGTPEPLHFSTEHDLLNQLHPGKDGLILQDDNYRGTFLPAVWESLPEPEQFLQHLKLKAGLPTDHWSDTLQVWRYSTESFGDSRPDVK